MNVIWADECRYLSKDEISRHKHAFFHFIYVNKGSGSISVGESNFILKPETIYMVPPFVAHTFFNSGDSSLKTYEIKFSLNNAQAECEIEKVPYCVDTSGTNVKFYMQTIVKEFDKELSDSEEIIRHIFNALIIELTRFYESNQKNETHSARRKSVSESYPEIDKVINYIHDNLSKDLSLECLAEVAKFEKSYFLRKFKHQTKSTPLAFVRNARVEKAKELLRYSDMNVSLIALATGFNTVYHFSNTFFKYTGKRPLEYRKELEKK